MSWKTWPGSCWLVNWVAFQTGSAKGVLRRNSRAANARHSLHPLCIPFNTSLRINSRNSASFHLHVTRCQSDVKLLGAEKNSDISYTHCLTLTEKERRLDGNRKVSLGLLSFAHLVFSLSRRVTSWKGDGSKYEPANSGLTELPWKIET